MNRSLSMGLGLVVGALLAAVGWVIVVPPPAALLRLHGYEYPVGDPSQPSARAAISEALELRSQQLLGREANLVADEVVLSGALEDWGYSVDMEKAVSEAVAGLERVHVTPIEHFGVWVLQRFSSMRRAVSVELQFDFHPELARERLERMAAAVEKEPVDAQMLIAEHKIIPSEAGRRMSVDATLVRMKNATDGELLAIDAVIERVPPRVTEEDLAPVDVTRVLSSYETSFRGKAGPRAVNIRTAGRYLNGAIILPGETLSFNDQVGRRIHGRGFVDAPVIINDELERDVGGGVCQVATTLHAAAVYGNLDVVRRRSHSRPSGYAPLGLDATVIDGKVDLKLSNPYDEPVLVHVGFPSRYVIRVELLGRDPDVTVEHAYAVTAREPFTRRVWRKVEAPSGGFEQKQKGREGMDVVSVLKIKQPDGTVDRRSYHSKYYPVPEVFWIGDGASPRQLPDMPEKAVALVVEGEEVARTDQDSENEDVPAMDEADGSDREPGYDRPRDTN